LNVEYIKTKVTISDILNLYNIKTNHNRASCPIHRGDNITSFCVDFEKNLFYCYKCKAYGDIFSFVSKMEGLTFYESVLRIAQQFNIEVDKEYKEPSKIEKEHKKWLSQMSKKTQNIEHKSFDMSTLGELYDINSYRQFNKELLNKFNIKYCANNKRIVVPIYSNGECIGVTMRRTNNHPAKWIHQPDEIKTRSLLYNIDNINKESVIVTEGIFDVLTYHMYGYNAICTFGSHLTAEQEKLLLQNTFNIILSYDMDEAGMKATNQVIDRLRYKVSLSIANIQLGKDPNNLNAYEIHNAIQNKLSINEWRKQYDKNN
jgi:DNA primase